MPAPKQTIAAKNKGFACEKIAADYLKKQGLIILTLNFHSRLGEIDIVALDKEILVIVEVKARHEQSTMSIRETINQTKKKKLIKTTLFFLVKNPEHANRQIRFDFFGIDTKKQKFDWLQQAFFVDDVTGY